MRHQTLTNYAIPQSKVRAPWPYWQWLYTNYCNSATGLHKGPISWSCFRICERLQQHQPSRMLRSSSFNLLTEHRTSTSAGDRAFSNAGPALWNSLPDSCRKASSVDSFKKFLKTHLFCLWFWLLVCVGHIQALCNLWKRRFINASLLYYY